jgi:phosphoribosylformylglycinamidine cyclo-ligase
MLRTFNCGVGMVMISPENEAQKLLERARGLGADCFEMGEVTVAGAEPAVRYRS